MAKKVVKPNFTRGRIFDKLAETFGDSTVGMYDGKLRFEIITDDGEVVQFSLAPVIHKTLVDEEECDELVPVAEQMAAYNAAIADRDQDSLAKKEAAEKKKAATKTKKAKTTKTVTEEVQDIIDMVKEAPVMIKTELTADEQVKLDELSKMLGGDF